MDGSIRVSAKTVDDAITEALIQLGVTSDRLEYEVIEKGSSGILGIFNSKPAKIIVWKKATMEDNVREFLEDVFGAMELTVKIEMSIDEAEETININLVGDDMGVLKKKRGQTLVVSVLLC